MERMRRWWLARYSLDELRDLAAAIWPQLALPNDTAEGLRSGG
jgi:hypothetical protein